MTTALRLAFASFVHSAFANLFTAIGLAAVLAPLLVLYGLKQGVVSNLVEELKNDPEILRIVVEGNRTITAEDVTKIRLWPQTGFVIGAPRSIASRVQMRASVSAVEVETVNWIPTTNGDPLLGTDVEPPEINEIILSGELARKFGSQIGDQVAARVYRNSQSEIYEMALNVVAILPSHRLTGLRALVSGERLERIAAFADNFAIDEAGGQGRPLADRIGQFSRVRLYATSIETVADLEAAITEFGFGASSNAGRIQWVFQLERVMLGVFGIIASAGVVGYAISLWAAIAENVRNARPQLSLLQLLGMTYITLCLFPLVEVICITTIGLLAAFLFALSASIVLNNIYIIGTIGGAICDMRVIDFLSAACGSYILAAFVAVHQSYMMLRISPSEALSESI